MKQERINLTQSVRSELERFNTKGIVKKLDVTSH